MTTRLTPKRFGAPYGGLNQDIAEWVLPDNVFTLSTNFSMRKKGLVTSLGWLPLTDQILEEGNVGESVLIPFKLEQFFQSSGSNDLICLTNKRAYRFDSPLQLWIPITQGTTPIATTLAAPVVVNDTVINVVSTTGLNVGEQILLGFGTSTVEYLIIDALSPTTITVSRPSWAPAGVGAQKVHSTSDDVNGLASMVWSNASEFFDTAMDQDVYYFTDGVNPVQRYVASAAFHTNQPGIQTGDSVQGIGVLASPILARCIRISAGFMILAHLTENGVYLPNKFRWSQIDDYEKWENEIDGSGQSGAFLFSGPDFIIRMEQLKREMFFYRDNSVEAISYVGLPDIFALRRTETRTGLIAHNALINLVDHHRFVGTDNMWTNNGVSYERFGDPIKKAFFQDTDPSQLPNIEMFHLFQEDESWVSYSSTEERSHNKAYLHNTIINGWSGQRIVDATTYGYYRRTEDLTWDAAPGTWDTRGPWYWNQRLFLDAFPLNLMGSETGMIFILEVDPEANGVPFLKRYESKLTDCDRGDLLKSVQRIRIGADPTVSATLSIYLGVAFSEMDPIVWKGPYTMVLAAGYEPYVYMDEYGRYFKIAIETMGNTTLQDIELAYYFRESI